jgi:HEPN domain-containing protein
MNVRPEVAEVLRQWVRKAEHDLEAAHRIMAVEENCPFDMVCFHCQQVAEKYLKCILTCLGIQAPRTHNLEVLAALISAEFTLPVPLSDLVELNPYAVNIRYADDWREPGIQDAQRALTLARQIRDAARAKLPAAAFE